MRKLIIYAWVFGLCMSTAASAQDTQTQRVDFKLNQADISMDIRVPDGWSILPDRDRQSVRLHNVGPGESKVATAFIQVFVEPRRDAEDALEQLRQFAAEAGIKQKKFLTIGGWPAVQVSRLDEQPLPDNAPALKHSTVSNQYTYIARGDTLVKILASAPPDSDVTMNQEMRFIASEMGFAVQGDAHRAEAELDKLRNAPAPTQQLNAVPNDDQEARLLDIETTPVNITPDMGANDRINTSGFGELELAVSPDGQNVVVALQSRRWVSSNDGGVSFPNSGRVGAGNGDPSVAWGQSGKFYMAWIDNSPNCGSGYLNPVPIPDANGNGLPDDAPNGLDCTGLARSDDNGQTFQSNIVNPPVVCIKRAPAGSPANLGECFPDQEHIAADRWNQGDTADDDQVYSTWRNFRPGGQNASLVCTSDSGVSWSAPFEIGVGEVFPRITVGPDGFVYIPTLGPGGFRLYKFTSCVNGLTPVPGFPVTVGGWNGFQCPFAGHDRCDQDPTSQTVIVDETDPNHVYYAYVNDRGNGSSGDSDIIVRDSLDGGLTWGAVGRIARANENVGARRIMPWLCTTAGSAVVTWYEQRGALPTDSTDFFGARVALDEGGDLVPMEEFVISEVQDNWCDIGWTSLTRWGNTDTQTSNAAEACPNQPQLAGQCGDGDSPNVTADSGTRCDFSDDDGVTFTNCLPAGSSPSGNNERCLTGGGAPKYGDYSGNACAGGKLFAAWASANAPDGLAPPDGATNPGVLFDVINLNDLGVPVITVPGNVHFGAMCPSDATQYQTLEVCNTGSANLQVDAISSNNPDFAVTIPSSSYPVTISPDFCFPFEVAYTPGNEIPEAILSIPSDDPDRPVIEVTADADLGEAAMTTFIADTGNFGEVCSGLIDDLNLTIQSNGSCPLEISSVSLSGADSGDFELPSGSFAGTIIEPGNSLLVPVRFAPDNFTAPNPRTASVNVTAATQDGDALPQDQTPVEGFVPAPDINVAIADSGAFGAVCKDSSKDLNLTLFNQGRCDLAISSISSSDSNIVLPSDTTYPLVLSHDADFNFPLRFEPTSCFDGVMNGTVTIASDDPDEPSVEVGVSFEAPCPNLVIDPAGLTGLFAFPATVVDEDGGLGCFSERSAVLRNSSICPLTITDISASGTDYTVVAPSITEPILLPGGEETLSVTVRFTPQGGGDPLLPEEILGLLTVTSDDPDAAQSAEMCGEGVEQSGIRTLVTDITSGIPLAVDPVERMVVRSKGKKTPSPINISETDVPAQSTTVCGNTVNWHLNLEYLPAVSSTGASGGKSSYEVSAKEGNLQDVQTFSLDQCEFREFQLQLQSSDGGGGSCALLGKGEACTAASQCCSGKCTGKSGAKSCK